MHYEINIESYSKKNNSLTKEFEFQVPVSYIRERKTIDDVISFLRIQKSWIEDFDRDKGKEDYEQTWIVFINKRKYTIK